FASLSVAAFVPCALFFAAHNRAVTGSWFTLPYEVSRYQYGVPTTFTVERNPLPHRALSAEQQIDYDVQAATHGSGTDTFRNWIERLVSRIGFLRFFLFAPLWIALPAFLPALRQGRFLWLAGSVAAFWIADNFYPYFYPHYVAAISCA